MLFLSKRANKSGNASGAEACFSIVGLFLSIALISGLAGLIYGLSSGNSPAVVAGSIVFGISFLLGTVFVLIIVFCLDSVRPKPNRRKAHRPPTHINNSQEITGISTVPRSELSNSPYPQILYPTIPFEFVDGSQYGFGKQTLSSPMQTNIFDSLSHNQPSTNGYHLRPDYPNHY